MTLAAGMGSAWERSGYTTAVARAGSWERGRAIGMPAGSSPPPPQRGQGTARREPVHVEDDEHNAARPGPSSIASKVAPGRPRRSRPDWFAT